MDYNLQYKNIYSAANATEAHLIKGLLEQESIDTILEGEDLAIATGGLPTDVMQVDIKVDEKKYTEALEIISNYERTLKEPVEDSHSWECEQCNQINPEAFEICCSCQANQLTNK